MQVHPEVRQLYLYEKRKVGHNRPDLDYGQVEAMAWVNVRNELTEQTKNTLNQMGICPRDYASEIEFLEREIQLQEVLDDEVECDEDY